MMKIQQNNIEQIHIILIHNSYSLKNKSKPPLVKYWNNRGNKEQTSAQNILKND